MSDIENFEKIGNTEGKEFGFYNKARFKNFRTTAKIMYGIQQNQVNVNPSVLNKIKNQLVPKYVYSGQKKTDEIQKLEQLKVCIRKELKSY